MSPALHVLLVVALVLGLSAALPLPRAAAVAQVIGSGTGKRPARHRLCPPHTAGSQLC